jgi:tetratricopeptide (TPR) repeat protein
MFKSRRIIILVILFLILCKTQYISNSYTSETLREDEQMIHVGVGAYQDGFYDIADRQFSLFLKNFPNHGKVHDVLYLLGKIHFQKERWREARTALLRIVQENKNFGTMDYTLFWMAQIEIKLGDFEASRRWLLTLLQNYPRFEWIDYAYYLLGCSDFESKKLGLAENSFKKVSLLSKRGELIRASTFWLAMVSLGQNEEEKAILYLKSLVGELKNDPLFYRKEVLLWLGEAQFKSGQFQDAKKTYQLFYDQFKTDPLIPHVHWKIGFCDYRLGGLRDSTETFKKFQATFKEDHPFSAYTHFILGEISLILGDYALAVKELTPVLQTPQPNPLLGTTLLVLYWNYLQLNEREQSFQMFQRLLKLNTAEDEKFFIQWLVAQGLYAEGKVKDALPYYFSLLNSKLRERAMFQIGKGYFMEGQFREALTNLDILLLEFPNLKVLDEALFIKAECLLLLGETVQAMGTLQQIQSLPHKNPWRLMALTQTGLRSLNLGEKESAEAAFRRILEDRSNHPLFFHAAFQMGNLSAEKRDFPGASQSYSLVLKGPVTELIGPTYFRIGEILIQEGREEKAFNSFEEALKSLAGNSIWLGITHLEIGNLHRRWGRVKEAEKSYRTAYTLSKDGQIRNAAKECLERLEAR